MGEFRIGRKFAQNSYPESPKGLSVPGASAWGDNATSKVTAAPSTPIAVCSATITPQATGKIRVTVSGMVANKSAGGAPEVTVLWLTHTGGPAAFPGDYGVLGDGITEMNLEGTGVDVNDAESFSCVVRYDVAAVNDLPITFPLGTPVTEA